MGLGSAACWECCLRHLKRGQRIIDTDNVVAEAMDSIDAEYEALVADMSLVAA